MRSTRQLNKTFEKHKLGLGNYKSKSAGRKNKVVSEKDYTKHHTVKQPIRAHVKCPHCGKAIVINIK